MSWLTRFGWPLVLLAIALLSVTVYGVTEVLGWREQTAFLSGNLASEEEVLHGAFYVIAWMQVLVVAPVAAMAGVGAGLVEIVVQGRMVGAGGALAGPEDGCRRS